MKDLYNPKNIIGLKDRTNSSVFNVVEQAILSRSIYDDDRKIILQTIEFTYNQEDITTVTAILFSEDVMVQIVFSSIKSEFDNYSEEFSELLSSFRFL